MDSPPIPELPPRLASGRERFERWRSQRTGRAPIPDSLWQLAMELTGEFGVHLTARGLRLNYTALKSRVYGAAVDSPGAPAPLRDSQHLVCDRRRAQALKHPRQLLDLPCGTRSAPLYNA